MLSPRTKLVKPSLKLETNPDIKIFKRLTLPLHYAVRTGDKEIIKGLLDSEVDAGSLDKSDMTPLRLAINHKQWDIANLIVDHPLFKTKNIGYALLDFRAFPEEGLSLAKKIIEKIKQSPENAKEELNRINQYGTTILYDCCFMAGGKEFIKLLLEIENGCDVNLMMRNGWTIFTTYNIDRKDYTFLDLFLSAGADFSVENKRGCSALSRIMERYYLNEISVDNLNEIFKKIDETTLVKAILKCNKPRHVINKVIDKVSSKKVLKETLWEAVKKYVENSTMTIDEKISFIDDVISNKTKNVLSRIFHYARYFTAPSAKNPNSTLYKIDLYRGELYAEKKLDEILQNNAAEANVLTNQEFDYLLIDSFVQKYKNARLTEEEIESAIRYFNKFSNTDRLTTQQKDDLEAINKLQLEKEIVRSTLPITAVQCIKPHEFNQSTYPDLMTPSAPLYSPRMEKQLTNIARSNYTSLWMHGSSPMAIPIHCMPDDFAECFYPETEIIPISDAHQEIIPEQECMMEQTNEAELIDFNDVVDVTNTGICEYNPNSIVNLLLQNWIFEKPQDACDVTEEELRERLNKLKEKPSAQNEYALEDTNTSSDTRTSTKRTLVLV